MYYLAKVILRISEIGMFPMLTASGTCIAASGSLRASQHFFPFVHSLSESHMAASNVPALSRSETVAAPT